MNMQDRRQQALVRLSNAGIRHGSRWLVHGVDMDLARGEIVTLIGPNGSGKSTTARLALGLCQPDQGEVWRKPGLTIGYVPQKITVDTTLPLTVDRFMRLTGVRPAGDIAAAMERTGVAALMTAEIQTLSGGEFRRVLLARAISRKPDLLVLDEPTASVDFSGEMALYEIIGQVRDELDCAVLLISHDLHVVMAATDRVICLNGHVCCHGTPTVVAENSEYRRLFGARAAASLAVYQHHHDHTHLPDGRVRHADGTISDHCHPDDGHHPPGAVSQTDGASDA